MEDDSLTLEKSVKLAMQIETKLNDAKCLNAVQSHQPLGEQSTKHTQQK